MNYFKTGVLLAGMTGLFMAVGFLIGGQAGMIIAFVVVLGMNVFAYWNSDKAVLRMHNAREIDRVQSPVFYDIVADLARRADLPMPKVYLIDTSQPNAFATGRSPDHAAVAATRGLLNMLTEEEIAGVMAHELGHVKNRDTLIMSITATIAGAIGMLAQFGFFFGGGRGRDNPLGGIAALAMMILAPMAAMVVQMAISRTREYGADRAGAEISGNPGALASALQKMSNAARNISMESAERNPSTGQLFIINPLSGQKMDNLFSTHPDTENRIAALRGMAQELGGSAKPRPRSDRTYRSSVPRTGRRS